MSCRTSSSECRSPSGIAAEPELERLLSVLRGLRARHEVIAIACSGGLDSRFLTHAALLAGITPVLFHVSGPHVPAVETAQAQAWAAREDQGRGLCLRTLVCDPLDVPEVRANGRERCYFCKHTLFTRLLAETASVAGGASFCLCDGSNHSDGQGYRPGLRALRELGIRSPLAEAGLDKPVIRKLAACTGLERPEQPSRPCLLTRLDYGVEPTRAILAGLEALETAMEDILPGIFGRLPDFRVRLAGPHLDEGFALQVAEEVTEEGQRLLAAALLARSLPVPALLPDREISGYYDRRAAS